MVTGPAPAEFCGSCGSVSRSPFLGCANAWHEAPVEHPPRHWLALEREADPRWTVGEEGLTANVVPEPTLAVEHPYTTPVLYRADLVWCGACGAAVEQPHEHEEAG
jgi:hypothetical protein